jgi:hypothetical protein
MTTVLSPAPTTPAIEPAQVSRPRPRLRRMRYEPEPGSAAADPPLAPAPAPVPAPGAPDATTAELAAAHRSAGRVLRLALEVLDGRRPPAHLTGYVDASVARYWRVKTQQRRVRSPARLRRMRLCLPRAGIAEAAVVCEIDGRVHALAARFERAAGAGWRCTALRLG